MNSGSGQPVINAVIERHFDELQFLLSQRASFLKSSEWQLRDLRALEDRIQAHLDGLRVAGTTIIPFLEGQLNADDEAIVFASAFVLLCSNSEEAEKLVVDTFLLAKEGQLVGIRDALCQSPILLDVLRLQEAVGGGPASVAVAAAHVLAVHRQLDHKHNRWREFLSDEDQEVRRSAWRVVALADVGM